MSYRDDMKHLPVMDWVFEDFLDEMHRRCVFLDDDDLIDLYHQYSEEKWDAQWEDYCEDDFVYWLIDNNYLMKGE